MLVQRSGSDNRVLLSGIAYLLRLQARFPFECAICVPPVVGFIMLFSAIGYGFEVYDELISYTVFSDSAVAIGLGIFGFSFLSDFGSFHGGWKVLARLLHGVATAALIVGAVLAVDKFPAGA
jgi:hypothetical protein